MKYIILVPDGMADLPVAQLDNRTPLQAANTPHMDYMAQHGLSGLVQTIPEGMSPGSDVGNLALLGYDPRKNFSGRAPLEAASMGIKLEDDEVAFRCNLITATNGMMVDYSAGHITSEEAAPLINFLERAIDWPDIKFYPGKSYRHLMVLKTLHVAKMLAIKTTPPHDILNQPLQAFLPSGSQSEILLNLMEKSKEILNAHEINKMRLDVGENPANMIWLWGQGCKPQLPLFKDRYGLSGSVISAVDLVNGIGRLAGLNVIDVPGANGYYDTNYLGKAQYAIESLKSRDFVYVHVESPDEAGHNGDYEAKVACIERFDREVVGTVLNHFKGSTDVRILVSPDHPTPVSLRTHTNAPVPFIIYGQGVEANKASNYSEAVAGELGLKFNSGEAMIKQFLGRE